MEKSAVANLVNESFNDSRPSFRSIVAKFETNKGSFSYSVTSGRSLRKMMKQKQQSVRSMSKRSVMSSDLGDIIEDEEDEVISKEGVENIEHNLMQISRALSDVNLLEETPEELEEENDAADAVSSVFTSDSDLPVTSRIVGSSKYPTGKFDDVYDLGNELGAGAYAVVKDCFHKESRKCYAVKIIEVDSMDKADFDALQVEIEIMGQLSHPNIVHLYETYRENEHYYMVTEKMVGGELLDRVVQKTFYNEKEARDTCLVLFEAMRYCHEQKVAHRDLKPENLLLQSNDNDSNIKIADFGFAKHCPKSGLRTMCGTPGYVAPEILNRFPYDTQCDLWSLGVIVYILLGGYSPFEEPTQDQLFRKIRAGDYEFHEEFWDPVSEDAKDFIRSLLVVHPRKRRTAKQALEHKWMTASGDVLASQDLGTNLTKLKNFNAKRKFKAAVKTVIATQKLSSLFPYNNNDDDSSNNNATSS